MKALRKMCVPQQAERTSNPFPFPRQALLKFRGPRARPLPSAVTDLHIYRLGPPGSASRIYPPMTPSGSTHPAATWVEKVGSEVTSGSSPAISG